VVLRPTTATTLAPSPLPCGPPSAHLQCPQLRKLFLSNNKVVLVDPLIDLRALETLCLYRNTILDLTRCITVLQQVRRVGCTLCLLPTADRHVVRRGLPRTCGFPVFPCPPLLCSFPDSGPWTLTATLACVARAPSTAW
jgi:hypothetical protein